MRKYQAKRKLDLTGKAKNIIRDKERIRKQM